MFHVKTQFVKQYLTNKSMPLNSLSENYTKKLYMNSADIICTLSLSVQPLKFPLLLFKAAR